MALDQDFLLRGVIAQADAQLLVELGLVRGIGLVDGRREVPGWSDECGDLIPR
ncbi:hypothetical protein [Streptomyces qinglanensis]|uniref:hypothetical protein n=1 Tax=Streptomyces qinglanensis TaxID=943816 RepID=UPI00379E95C7